MSIKELIVRNDELEALLTVYERLFHDVSKSLYHSEMLRKLILKTRKELQDNQELIYENTLGGEH